MTEPLIRKLKSPHDSFFQAMMERIEVARSFFDAHLSKELREAIDLTTLQLADAARREPNNKSTYTDITYHCLTASKSNAYLHVEQERVIDKRMLERVMQYNARLYTKHKNQGHDKFPLVLNFIVYNGSRENYPYYPDITQYYEEPELAKLVIGKPFQLINLAREKDEEILEHGVSGLMEFLLKRASSINFTEWMETNKGLLSKLPVGSYLNMGVEYALHVGKEKAEDIINSFTSVYPQLKEAIMTAAQQLRKEGIQQGRQEGMQQGREGEKKDIAKKMLFKLHLDLDTVQKATDLDKGFLETLKEQ